MAERCILITYQQSLVKRNATIAWFANFFIAGSMTMLLPFISLYIDTFGQFSASYVQKWSGLIFAITFVTAFIFSPIWGRIGDRYGRKNILIISATGLALSVLLMGFATSVWQLFFLRMIMGFFTGFVPMSQALIATQTPKDIAGRVLGTLQTGSVLGTLMGPLLGGLLADALGYSITFRLVSITVFFSALIVLFGIKEMQADISEINQGKHLSRREVLLFITSHPALLIVMLISTLVQIAHFSIQPILPLFVAQLNGTAHIALFSGIAFSATGLGNLLMARRWGKMGDRFGYLRLTIILLFFVGLFYFPISFVTTLLQFILLRFLIGLVLGGIDPNRMAYIRQEAPLSTQGEVLGYNTSLRFLGNVVGPALGGILASLFGFSSVFFITGALLIGSSVIMAIIVLKSKKSSHAYLAKKWSS